MDHLLALHWEQAGSSVAIREGLMDMILFLFSDSGGTSLFHWQSGDLKREIA